MRTATCHPDRKHYSKGLCCQCYQKKYHKVYGKQRWRPNKADLSLLEPGINPDASLFRYGPNYNHPYGKFVNVVHGYKHNGHWHPL